MDQIPEECHGCIGIADDITVHGHTKAEHNAHLQNPMHVAYKYGLVFNPQKTHVKAPAVNFFGCLYEADGVQPDPDRVNAVNTLPAPTNVTELQEFLGMVMYLSSFILGLSTLTAPLHELLKKDTDFTWNTTYEAAFKHVKDAVISNTLQYFNPSLPVTIQVNASQVGLDAALLQNDKPVAFASEALTKDKHHCTNIEREMLTVIFRAQRFRTHIYGRSFTIKSDHKPLESISQKNLADMPAKLQHMLLCLQGMTTFSVTAPVRKWPHPMPSPRSVHILAPTSHWPLPFIMLTCPQTRRKHYNKPLWVMHRYIPLLTSSSQVGQITSRRFLTHNVLNSNIVRPSLPKIALSSMEKPSLFLPQKGREYYTNYTSSTKESPNLSCSHVDVSTGLV